MRKGATIRFLMRCLVAGLWVLALSGGAATSHADGGKGDLLVVPEGSRQVLPTHSDRTVASLVKHGDMPDAWRLSFNSTVVPAADDSIYFAQYEDYDFARFADQSMSIPLELTTVVGATLAMGFKDWDWGSSKFRVSDEGYFGKSTKNGGMDKLGHAWSAALISDFFIDRINESGVDPRGAAITGAALSMGIMTAIEVMDGFSGDHGFSPQDIVADIVGAGFSFIRNTYPWLRNKLDYRMEYVPSGNHGTYSPWSDYSGQKYVLALKMAGFESLADTPARFFELQLGYYARGFTLKEKMRGKKKQRELYVAIGINLQELFFGRYAAGEPTLKTYGRRFFEYVQVPYTYGTYAKGAYDY